MINVNLGDRMPSLLKHCNRPSMVAYAGATWDWHRIHYDMDYLKSLGLDRPIVDGQVFGAYAVQAIQDWMGEGAFVTALEFRFANLVFADEWVRCDGEVVGVTAKEVSLKLRIDVVDTDGTVLRSAVEPIFATVTRKE